MRLISLTAPLLATLPTVGATVASAQKPAASGKGFEVGSSIRSWDKAQGAAHPLTAHRPGSAPAIRPSAG